MKMLHFGNAERCEASSTRGEKFLACSQPWSRPEEVGYNEYDDGDGDGDGDDDNNNNNNSDADKMRARST
jgi:hypothetical protein